MGGGDYIVTPATHSIYVPYSVLRSTVMLLEAHRMVLRGMTKGRRRRSKSMRCPSCQETTEGRVGLSVPGWPTPPWSRRFQKEEVSAFPGRVSGCPQRQLSCFLWPAPSPLSSYSRHQTPTPNLRNQESYSGFSQPTFRAWRVQKGDSIVNEDKNQIFCGFH